MATMEQLELRREVITRIRELEKKDPNAYNMQTFGCRRTDAQCGTSSCLAGWTVWCVNPAQYLRYVDEGGAGSDCMEEVAQHALGLTFDQKEFMFFNFSATAAIHEETFKLIENNPSIDELELEEYFYDKSLERE